MAMPHDAVPEVDALQMLRADVSLRDFQRWMGSRRLEDPDHAMHCLLRECFGDLAPKPFRLIMPRGVDQGVLYGYGRAGATALRDQASTYADPLQARVMPADRIGSKPMPQEWQAGRRLGFEARIRPIVRSSRNGDNRPGREWDAYQLEAIQHPKGGMERGREEVYAEWLSGELDRRGGARLEPGRTELVSFQRTRAVYRARARYSEGPDAIMRGVLTITDGTAFTGLLTRGVGRHRAYGYGMLLLRPTRT